MTSTLRTISHPEDELRIVPEVGRPPRTSETAATARPWWERPPAKERRFDMRHGGRGAGFLQLPDHPRQQHVIVKPTIAPSHGGRGGNWYKHGTYLQREGTQTPGRGQGFDGEQDTISVSQTLGRWQHQRDAHVFKVIISIRHADRLDLPTFVRRFITEKIERDLGVRVQWMAIVHTNTDHPHVHLLIRGRDADGQPLRIDGEYLWGGLRQRARELATQMLGMRTQMEIDTDRARSVTSPRWTELDYALHKYLDGERRIADSAPLTAMQHARLTELVRRGLAWLDADGWTLSMRWEATMKERRDDRSSQQPHKREQQHEQQPERTPDTTKQRERDDDERQRQVRIIDDLEQDLEWDR